MWILVEIEDTVRVAPHTLNRKEVEGITDEIERKYSNKILPDLGIALKLFDILQVGEATIYQGDGGAYAAVRFRLVVFSPQPREFMIGIVKAVGEDGIRVDIGFFDHVYISPSDLPSPSKFDPETNTWQWLYDEQHPLLIEPALPIRFEVRDVCFSLPTSKRGPKSEPELPLMNINASIAAAGTGMLSWWQHIKPNLTLAPGEPSFTYYNIELDQMNISSDGTDLQTENVAEAPPDNPSETTDPSTTDTLMNIE